MLSKKVTELTVRLCTTIVSQELILHTTKDESFNTLTVLPFPLDNDLIHCLAVLLRTHMELSEVVNTCAPG